MSAPLPEAALAQLFHEGRSFSHWHQGTISDAEIEAIHELVKLAPTSANQQPARFVWCRSAEARERLAAVAAEGNRAKILAAPVTVIIGYDLEFHEELPWLYPHTDARSWFTGSAEKRRESAVRNAVLQGAYLIMAARALGFDCGPMSGFDQDAATRAFFADQPSVRADFLCAIGHGNRASLHPRSPRPDFTRFNRIV